MVPGLHLSVDPVLELLPHDGVDHVCKISPAELGNLLARGQDGFDLPIVLGEVEHGLDSKTFELRHINVLDLVRVEDALYSHG